MRIRIAALARQQGDGAPGKPGAPHLPWLQRVRGKPRSTELVAGSGQRLVTTLPRV